MAKDEEEERNKKKTRSEKNIKEVQEDRKARRHLDFIRQSTVAKKAKQGALKRMAAINFDLLEKVSSCHSQIKCLHSQIQIYVSTHTNICIYTTKLCIYMSILTNYKYEFVITNIRVCVMVHYIDTGG